ncbi:MAG: beta-ketoacyl synthase N-terminal-like domain-containing protein [Candidatus Zipacnadales bacterium]
MTDRRRVMIVGIAPISAIGIGREDFTRGLVEGRQGIREVQSFNPAAFSYTLAAECLDFALEDFLESAKTYLDRCSQLTLAACAMALQDVGGTNGEVAPERVGLVLGTAYGPLDTLWAHTQRVQQGGLRRASSVLFLHSFVNTPLSLASIEFNICGPVTCFCQGLASAGAALQFAMDLIAEEAADLVLSGGVDTLSEVLYAALDEEGRLNGEFIPGEGAALLALRRDSTEALAELRAVAVATVPQDAESAECLARQRAIKQAGLAEHELTVYQPPREYGRPFGATLAMDICAAICEGLPQQPVLISCSDPAGLGCAAVLERP